MAPFRKFPNEGDTIGRLLAGYSNIEIGLMNCVQVATGDFDAVIRKMFGARGETKRIHAADKLGLPEYRRLRLATEFEKAIGVVKYCLKIRNQYAHWSGGTTTAAGSHLPISRTSRNISVRSKTCSKLKAHHVDAALLEAQEAYFVYADEFLAWINHEGRFRDKKLGTATKNPLDKPKGVKRPKLRL